jgi:hypothetical protein
MNDTKTPTIFLDNIGRTILGLVKKETPEELTVENPALILIQANPQTNQLQLQIIPLFLKEFQADKDKPTVWNFKKATLTTTEKLVLSPQLLGQYTQLFSAPAPAPAPEAQPSESPSVVKLFDE